MSLRKRLQRFLSDRGFHIRRLGPNELGRDAFRDMHALAHTRTGAVIFDVGANVGQSVLAFRSRFHSPIIHAFEPSPTTFAQLKRNTADVPQLHLNNFALGSSSGEHALYESSDPALTSLLPTGKDSARAQITATTSVAIQSLDDYCSSAGVTHIDVLKCDAQGFDLEVLKGARDMLARHRIHLIYVELNFVESYSNAARFEEVFAFLKDHSLTPMSFYNQLRREVWNAPLAEIDGLFRDPHFTPR
jgi:FkbM family methyltransferase